jgi:glycosyltransferase involved in cell wall biosynthesis
VSNPTTLTVAIPYYAGRDFLAKAVASVQRQTWPDWRLLVCDDRGSDERVDDLIVGSADVRQSYARNRVNLGMAGNWNRCLDLAETDLVTLLHSDDELMEGYCEQMVRAAEAYPQAAAFFCAARIIDLKGKPRFSFPDLIKRFLMPPRRRPVVLRGEKALSALLRGNFIMCPTVCYRKSRLGSRRFNARWKFVLDLDFFTRLLLDGETLVGLPAVAYAYRRHDLSATAQYTADLLRFREESGLYDALAETAVARGWEAAARQARGKRIIKLNLGYCAFRDLLLLRGPQAAGKLGLLAHLR